MTSSLRRCVALGLVLALTVPCAKALGQTATSATVPPRDDIANWQARLELARLLTQSGRHAEAAEQYHQVLKNRPNNAEARVGLARALFWSGKREEAAAALGKIPADSLTAEDRRLQAEIYLALNRHDQAIDALRSYLALRPNDLKARVQLADALSWRKRLNESLAQYEKVLAVAPDDRQVRRRYARVLGWAGRNEDAIRELRKSLGR